jgi:hypothetical protein
MRGKLKAFFWEFHRNELNLGPGWLLSLEKGGTMPQKANLTPVDKSDRREAERLDLEKHARLEAGLIDAASAIQPAPTAEHQHRRPIVLAGGQDDVQVDSSRR